MWFCREERLVCGVAVCVGAVACVSGGRTSAVNNKCALPAAPAPPCALPPPPCRARRCLVKVSLERPLGKLLANTRTPSPLQSNSWPWIKPELTLSEQKFYLIYFYLTNLILSMHKKREHGLNYSIKFDIFRKCSAS